MSQTPIPALSSARTGAMTAPTQSQTSSVSGRLLGRWGGVSREVWHSKWLMASRRAFADEYALGVNRAVELPADVVPADAVRALRVKHGLSERQARRYVSAARGHAGWAWWCSTIRLAPSLTAGLRR